MFTVNHSRRTKDTRPGPVTDGPGIRYQTAAACPSGASAPRASVTSPAGSGLFRAAAAAAAAEQTVTGPARKAGLSASAARSRTNSYDRRALVFYPSGGNRLRGARVQQETEPGRPAQLRPAEECGGGSTAEEAVTESGSARSASRGALM